MAFLSPRKNRFIFENQIAPSAFLERMDDAIPWDEIVQDVEVHSKKLGISAFAWSTESLLRMRFLQIWFDIHPAGEHPKWINHLCMRAFAKLNADLSRIYASSDYIKFKFALDECSWNADFIIALTQRWSGLDVSPAVESEFGDECDFTPTQRIQAWLPTVPSTSLVRGKGAFC